ncbi:gliding motility lipoprotein GldH [Lewinella sp. LCG006]|uniref:gliding motility lipoprotein GldH n=1 Tax=Lewinella sp. LCG006 TaxID=3231911 RepID=UPI003460B350
MNRLTYLLPFLALLGFSACGPNYVYQQTLEIPEDGWSYQDSLLATFEIQDTNTIYNLHLIVAHTTYFSYQNFYAQVSTQFPNGEQLTEQVSLELAAKGGIWLGDCSGEICTLDIPIQEGAYFNQAGTYQLSIHQYSRRDPLPEIKSILFALEATEATR